MQTIPKKHNIQPVMRAWRAALGKDGKSMTLRQFTTELNAVPGVRAVTYQAAGLWNTGRCAPLYERAQNSFLLASEGSWQRAFWQDVLAALDSAGK